MDKCYIVTGGYYSSNTIYLNEEGYQDFLKIAFKRGQTLVEQTQIRLRVQANEKLEKMNSLKEQMRGILAEYTAYKQQVRVAKGKVDTDTYLRYKELGKLNKRIEKDYLAAKFEYEKREKKVHRYDDYAEDDFIKYFMKSYEITVDDEPEVMKAFDEADMEDFITHI